MTANLECAVQVARVVLAAAVSVGPISHRAYHLDSSAESAGPGAGSAFFRPVHVPGPQGLRQDRHRRGLWNYVGEVIVRRQADILLVVTCSLALTVIIVASPSASAIRVILGLPFVLFFPGYALTAALFPRKDD